MMQPPLDEAAVVETLLGPLSWTPRQAKTLTKASVLIFCDDDFELLAFSCCHTTVNIQEDKLEDNHAGACISTGKY